MSGKTLVTDCHRKSRDAFMCSFIQFPDLKNAFNYWQNWSERQEQQKRQQKPVLLWPLTARPSPVQERYHNWPFGALNIYKHFPAHSPFFPFNTSIHSFTAVFPRRFLLRTRLKKKKKSSVRVQLFTLHTEAVWRKHWPEKSWNVYFGSQNQSISLQVS